MHRIPVHSRKNPGTTAAAAFNPERARRRSGRHGNTRMRDVCCSRCLINRRNAAYMDGIRGICPRDASNGWPDSSVGMDCQARGLASGSREDILRNYMNHV